MIKDKTKPKIQESRKIQTITRLGEYWVRGAIYILVLLLVFYTVRPFIGYVSELEHKVGFFLAIIVLFVFAPTAAGWIGAKFFAPLVDSWQSIQDVQSWEDRIVDELSPGKKQSFPVVLVDWPNPEIRTAGILASKYTSSCGKTELACVYFPGAPDPTRGGALRIVSVDCIEMTDWTMSDLFSNCVTFGATGPELFSGASQQNK